MRDDAAMPMLDEIFQAVLDAPLHRALNLAYADPGDPPSGLLLPVEGLAVNPSGFLHGGLAPTLLDVACFVRAVPDLDEGTTIVTHSASCSLLRGVRRGGEVSFVGQVDRRARTLVFCSAQAFDGAGALVASGQVVKSVVTTAPA